MAKKNKNRNNRYQKASPCDQKQMNTRLSTEKIFNDIKSAYLKTKQELIEMQEVDLNSLTLQNDIFQEISLNFPDLADHLHQEITKTQKAILDVSPSTPIVPSSIVHEAYEHSTKTLENYRISLTNQYHAYLMYCEYWYCLRDYYRSIGKSILPVDYTVWRDCLIFHRLVRGLSFQELKVFLQSCGEYIEGLGYPNPTKQSYHVKIIQLVKDSLFYCYGEKERRAVPLLREDSMKLRAHCDPSVESDARMDAYIAVISTLGVSPVTMDQITFSQVEFLMDRTGQHFMSHWKIKKDPIWHTKERELTCYGIPEPTLNPTFALVRYLANYRRVFEAGNLAQVILSKNFTIKKAFRESPVFVGDYDEQTKTRTRFGIDQVKAGLDTLCERAGYPANQFTVHSFRKGCTVQMFIGTYFECIYFQKPIHDWPELFLLMGWKF